ncbi:cell division control protein 14, SIN component-domain-containing protein [Crassisporium funariophilum]|nr:cell division control protein 14, SIN component-domain-containing protein [Crassisporium funariophilum]
MAFGDVLAAMRESLQGSLDELTSPRTSARSQMKALQSIERHLAVACCGTTTTSGDSEERDAFLALQFTFQCNVPAKLLGWITMATWRLGIATNGGVMDEDQGREAEELAAQLALSLSLVQGVALNHDPSKIDLGRKCALEILLDLLLASRHLTIPAEKAPPKQNAPPLTSVVLDTLLCILVDSSAALRSFEEANGTQAVVKILKRAGTPREVRMKCLEFLYFYLLDETPTPTSALTSTLTLTSTTAHSHSHSHSHSQPTPPPTAPATPIRAPKPYLSATPLHPTTSRYGSSTFSFSASSTTGSTTPSAMALALSGSGSGSSSGSASSRSASGGSVKSFSSTSSNASSSTTASSVSASASPEKPSATAGAAAAAAAVAVLSPAKSLSFSKAPGKRITTPQNLTHPHPHRTPPNSPPPSSSSSSFNSAARFPQQRSMMLLKKEVDYVPQSPKKVAGVGARHPGQGQGHGRGLSMSGLGSVHSRSRSRLISGSAGESEEIGMGRSAFGEGRAAGLVQLDLERGVGGVRKELSLSERRDGEGGRDEKEREKEKEKWRTTEEKKELLGTMLGNVDALVEGVRKAGIWGLG